VVPLTDLAPTREVMGGSQRRVFGTDAVDSQLRSSAMKKKTGADLPPSKPVKGGGAYSANDNTTLIRKAKPASSKKKDLPARKDVKGGKKITD